MCSQYTLKTTATEILLELDQVQNSTAKFDDKYFPSSVAPVVVNEKGRLKLTPMKFSLVPSWSKDSKVKFATHNARIETVLEKPTWKKPFVSQHCVVPLTGFCESVYSGPLEGNIIHFSDEKNKVLYAAGIYDFWKDTETPQNSFYSFSILTQEPSPFILEYGHDRTPIFIGKSFIRPWLEQSKKDSEALRSDLLRQAYHPGLAVSADRPLKAGWEKRK